MKEFGCQSETKTIRKLLLKHPREAFISDENLAQQWKALNYAGCPDFGKAVDEYDRFVELLSRFGMEILFLPENGGTGLDSIYTHDPLIVTGKGAILCNMAKAGRKGEPAAASDYFAANGIPVYGAITGDGRLEGGDVVWMDERTVAVGHDYRTNAEGIRQLTEILGDAVDEVVTVPVPHWKGPDDVFHLMSILSPIDDHLVLVYPRLMPVPFLQWLQDRHFTLLEVPDSEFGSLACNVLTVAPRKCVMISGNHKTQRILEEAGVEVLTYQGEEISVKGAGGPTCLTRPILRG